MTEETISQPSKSQIAKLVKSLLGPEEEWDDAAAEFVLTLHGIDPGESKARLGGLVDKIIREKTDRGEEVLESLRELQSRLKAS
jgi:hypothetical protein